MSSKARDGNVPESPAPSTWSTAGSGTRAILALLSKAGAHCEAPQGNILLCFPWMDIPSVGLYQRMLQTSERAARTAALLVPSIQRNPNRGYQPRLCRESFQKPFPGNQANLRITPQSGTELSAWAKNVNSRENPDGKHSISVCQQRALLSLLSCSP